MKKISKKKAFWTVLAIGVASIATGGVALAAAPTIGAALSAVGFGAAGGTLSGAAASSAGLAFLGGGSIAAGGAGMAGGTLVVSGLGSAIGGGLTAACASWEKGETSKAKQELHQMAQKDKAQYRKAYEQNKDQMSEGFRQEWEKYL